MSVRNRTDTSDKSSYGSIGHPLLGDDVYGSGKSPFNLCGQTLHAGVLGFIHPTTKEYVEYSADLPEYFQKVISRLRNS